MSQLRDIFTDPIRMIRDLRVHAPKSISYWGQAINFPQMIGGLIFITHPLGAWIFISWALGMVFVGRIYRLRGLSPWLSLCHVTWLPLYPFLLQAVFAPEASIYYAWIVYVTITITASLVMDFRAVYGTLQGRTPPAYESGMS